VAIAVVICVVRVGRERGNFAGWLATPGKFISKKGHLRVST
jgi:hypothetical protein